MKRYLIALFVIIAAAAGTFYYLNLSSGTAEKISNLVPETSLFVIHLDGFSNSADRFKSFENFDVIPGANQISTFKTKLDSLADKGAVPQALLNLDTWISIHSNGSDDLNTLFLVAAKGFDWNDESIVSIFEMLFQETFKRDVQTLNDKEIATLSGKNTTISYGINGNSLFWSKESVLVEDVIRAIDDSNARLFGDKVLDKKTSKNELHINGSRLNELSRVFLRDPEEGLSNTDLIYSIEVIDEDGSLNFNGLARGDLKNKSETSLFAKNLISSESAVAKWSGIELKQESTFSNALNDQVLKIGLENGQEVEVMEVLDSTLLVNELNNVALNNLNESDSIVYAEQYMYANIGYINSKEFLPSVSTFFRGEEFYYSVFQNYWIIGANVDAVKRVLLDFDEENTLGRNVSTRRELDELIQETNFTLIKNFNFGAEIFENKLKPKWKAYLNENNGLRERLDRFRIQANSAGNQEIISGDLLLREPRTLRVSSQTQEDLNSPEVVSNVFAQADIITKPFIVRNHNSGGREELFQDQSGVLYLSDLQGSILWQKQLEASIIGNIIQVDFYNNKKLQYLMMTDSLIHLIDRNGNDVEGFPIVHNAGQNLSNLAVIDYDNSKRYRYLIEGRFGDVILTDKKGQYLEGWNPKSLEDRQQLTPFHTRVRGRDCFVAIDYLGQFTLLNRRAEAYPGFPVKTELRLSGDVFFQKGPDFKTTSVSMLGKDGQMVSLNFLGEVVDRKQLFKPSAETSFELINDVLGSTYSILQTSKNNASILNQKGDELFSIDLPSEDYEIEFYNFRNGKGIYSIRDLKNNKLSIINTKGETISQPIDCDQPASILFYQNTQEYQVFVNFTNQLTQYSIDAL